MRIVHYQCHCHAGDFDRNLAKVAYAVDRARDQGADILMLPESLLTGYFSDAAKAWASSFTIDSEQVRAVLDLTRRTNATVVVGFNERRGDELYNTVLVAESGGLLGTYSKACPCFEYFTPGREFPVFEKHGVKFGVVICADGGYVEPTRILAFKGARLILAPHYNYIDGAGVLRHYRFVRSDHTARAVENGVWFFRGNNVNLAPDAGIERPGVGYGDSYLVDPYGEIIVRSEQGVECFVQADIDLSRDLSYMRRRAVRMAQALRDQLTDAVDAADPVKEHFC